MVGAQNMETSKYQASDLVDFDFLRIKKRESYWSRLQKCFGRLYVIFFVKVFEWKSKTKCFFLKQLFQEATQTCVRQKKV